MLDMSARETGETRETIVEAKYTQRMDRQVLKSNIFRIEGETKRE